MANPPMPENGITPLAQAAKEAEGYTRLLKFGDPNAGVEPGKLFLRDPSKLPPKLREEFEQKGLNKRTFDGKPFTEVKLFGGRAKKDAGEQSATVIMGKKTDKYYDPNKIRSTPIVNEEIPWETISAVRLIDDKGEQVDIERQFLRITKPRTPGEVKAKNQSIATDTSGPTYTPSQDELIAMDDDEPIDRIVEPKQKPTTSPPEPKPSNVPNLNERYAHATEQYPRYVDTTTTVTRKELEADPHFQEVLKQTREVVQEIKQLRSQVDSLQVLPDIASQIRDVGTWSKPDKANDPNYKALTAALTKRGLNHDEVLLAVDYLTDEARRAVNTSRLSQWKEKFQAEHGEQATRKSILDMVERGTEGNVAFSADAVEMNMTTEDRNAGYQDIRAVQLVSDALLDTYDANARTAWVDKDGKLTADGSKKMQEFNTLFAKILKGEDIPVDQQALAAQLKTKYEEFKKLTPDEAVTKYRGLVPGDAGRLKTSVARWREKHGVEPYRPGDLDMILTKGTSLFERRADYPDLLETTDTFTKKALQEKPRTAAAALVQPAAVVTSAETPPSSVTAQTVEGDKPIDLQSTTEVPTRVVVDQKPVDTSTTTLTDAKPAPNDLTPTETLGEPLPAVIAPTTGKPIATTSTGEPAPAATTVTTEPAPAITEPAPEPKPVEPLPTPAVPMTELHAAVVATKTEVGHKVTTLDWRGHEKEVSLESQELVHGVGRQLAELMKTEQRRKWDLKNQPWTQTIATYAERIYRGTIGDLLHHVKEQKHAIELLAKTGLEGRFTYQTFEAIDAKARAALADEFKKKNIFGKFWTAGKEMFLEIGGLERELHAKRLEIAEQMRQDFETNPLNADNPLFQAKWGDYAAQDEVARRIAATAYDDTLRVAQGEQRTTIDIDVPKDSLPGKFINEHILKPVIAHGLNNNGPLDATTEIRIRTELTDYFLSKEFQDWRAELIKTNPEAAKLDLSLSYATNIFDVAKNSLLPNVQSNRDYWRSNERQELDLKLTLGTARFGPNGEIPSQMWGEKRVAMNERLWKKLQDRRNNSADVTKHKWSEMFSAGANKQSVKAQMLMAWAQAVPTSELTLGAIAGYGVSRLATTAIKATTNPLWKGLGIAGPHLATFGVTGTIAGAKDYMALRTERTNLDMQKALGYTRPEDAVRAVELAKYDYHKIDMSDRVTQLHTFMDKPGTLTDADIFPLLGLVADADARINIGSERNINLWTIKNAEDAIALSGITSPDQIQKMLAEGNFQAATTALDLARAQAKTKIIDAVNGNPALKKTILTSLGYAETVDIKTVIGELAAAQRNHLIDGITISDPLKRALGNVEVQADMAVRKRNDAFESYRRWHAVKHGAKVGLASTVVSLVSQEAIVPAIKTVWTGLSSGIGGNWNNWHWEGGTITRAVFGETAGAVPPLATEPQMMTGTSEAGSTHVGLLRFSDNLKVVDGNLIEFDAAGNAKVVIANFHPEFRANGLLTEKTFDALRAHGIALADGNVVDIHSTGMHSIDIGGRAMQVPNELHWVRGDDAHSRDLVLDVMGKNGKTVGQVVVVNEMPFTNGQAVDAQAVIDAMKHSDILSVHDSGAAASDASIIVSIKDAATGVVHDIHPLVPPGMHMVETAAGSHTYNLVSDADPNTVLLHDVKFDATTGKLLNEAALKPEATSHGLTIAETQLPGIENRGGGVSGLFDKKVFEMGNEKGFHGPWGWLEDRIEAKGSGVVYHNAGDNFAKNLFRGTFENYYDMSKNPNEYVEGTFLWRIVGKHVNYNAMQPDVVFHKVPHALFDDAPLVKLGHLSDEAIKLFTTDGQDYHKILIPSDAGFNMADVAMRDGYAHRLAFELGYIGRVATKDEVQFMLDYFGENTTIAPFQTTITEAGATLAPNIIENVLTKGMGTASEAADVILPLGYRRPLEAPEAPKKTIPPTHGGGKEVSPPSYDYYKNQDTYNGTASNRSRLRYIAGNESERERQERALPILLNAAFTKWNTPAEQQAQIQGLTPPEQMEWLRIEAERQTQLTPSALPITPAAVPLSPTQPITPVVQVAQAIPDKPTSEITSSTPTVVPVPNVAPINQLDKLASILGVTIPEPSPTTPDELPSVPASPTEAGVASLVSSSTEPQPSEIYTPSKTTPKKENKPTVIIESASSTEQNLRMFIADENNSPVSETGKSEAIVMAQQFLSLADLEQAEKQGGLTKAESGLLYQDMLSWLSKQNAIDLIADDPTFNPNQYQQAKQVAQSFIWDDETEEKKLANAVMRFIKSHDSKFPIFTKGNAEANLHIVFSAYDLTRNTSFKTP